MKPNVHFQWLSGMSYQEVWDFQSSVHQALIEEKRKRSTVSGKNLLPGSQKHRLIFCEHNHVYTLGKSGSMTHLLLSDEELETGNIEFFKINRGGDITYHGPGQITGYPVFDLDEFFTDVHRYVRTLEEAVILLLAKYNLKGLRMPGYTGVWLGPNHTSNKYRKICAIGVHLSRWVSMHGFAFNINTDLTYFDKIIPCGIIDEDKTVTSLAKETGYEHSLIEVGDELARIFKQLFDFNMICDGKDNI